MLSVDRVRFTRAIATFVGHAMRTAEQGPVRVHAAPSTPGQIRIEVGVPSRRFAAAQLEALLDPNRSPGTAEHRGLALGLGLARCVIEFHSGTVSVEDREPEGSAFCVDLPIGARLSQPRLSTLPPDEVDDDAWELTSR